MPIHSSASIAQSRTILSGSRSNSVNPARIASRAAAASRGEAYGRNSLLDQVQRRIQNTERCFRQALKKMGGIREAEAKGQEVQYAAGLALAFSGESSRSEALAGDLEKRFPADAFVKFTYAPHSVTRKALEIGL